MDKADFDTDEMFWHIGNVVFHGAVAALVLVLVFWIQRPIVKLITKS